MKVRQSLNFCNSLGNEYNTETIMNRSILRANQYNCSSEPPKTKSQGVLNNLNIAGRKNRESRNGRR